MESHWGWRPPRGTVPRSGLAGLAGDGRRGGGGRDHSQQIDPAPIGAQDPEFQFADLDGLAAARQAPELLHQQAADGGVFLVGKRRAEVVVEIAERRERAHVEFALAFAANRLIVLDVVFVVDLPNDLLY